MLFNKNNVFNDFGYMIDCSRGAVPTIDNLKKLVDILSAFDYNYLMLYTEDIYEIDNEPYFGYMRGRYSKEEIKELDQYCISKNIELRACIQTLAHLGRIKRHKPYTSLFEIDDILTVKDERTYELIDKMLCSISKMFTCKKIHIGMDEAWALGRGKYLDINGREKTYKIMEYHLQRVSKIAEKYGFVCDIWADMLFNAYNECDNKDEFKIDIPSNITPVSWRYWKKEKQASEEEFLLYKKITNNNFAFAGGAQKWSGFVANNTYSFLAADEQIASCIKFDVKRYLLTSWGDGGAEASMFSILPTLFYVSLLAHDIKLNAQSKKYFKDVIGMDFNDFLLADKLNRLTLKDDDLSFNNLSFIYLYNDLLQGLFNETVIKNASLLFTLSAKKIKKNIANKEYGYLFQTLYDLANVLSIKANLGNMIYQHYCDKNIKKIKEDIRKIKKVCLRLDIFINSFENQWHKENKSFGFEKNIIRLGGLKERLNYTIRRLQLFVKNKISKIDELEEKHLPVSINYYDANNLENNCFNSYVDIVSAGSLREL
ncbi:MAG: beta-N-acetylhexosaminidase [Erysipelotrichaceae bacterium]|nr:beta-N-acetylhexosaminidase [Erysipelotrichaceae bacterium]